MATGAAPVEQCLTGTPWAIRLGQAAAKRPALEMYEAETLVDVVVRSSVAPQMLRGARRGVSRGRPCAIAWGRLPADSTLPVVLFTGGRWAGRKQRAEVIAIGGFCWLAVAYGRFTTVGVEHVPMSATRLAVTAAGVLAAAHAAPAVTSIGPLRRRLFPGLAGVGEPGHVALTFDDGPDPRSTPAFLAALREYEVKATFFLLGRMLKAAPDLGRELAESGHEIAVHGWEHRCMLLRGPAATYDDLARAMESIVQVTGTAPRRYRPPTVC
ncbi:polysaccharide deacetylase family protein [Actinomadura sp. NPDC000600]|uniref:polysaccharide deacetylase family protein n=1 Tax=Actinomadura sp. NPDC000600 TaxID=3154262 RepID=UPI003392B074